ncbi:MAG: GNAT family N-acetyltransferase [Endomicrobium sp.]|jgi:ribosomal protein S18 acetylase RimI-like enzyme|nr:GNAT family N-acetyltransferase [Endomicrobium sp.]
MRIQIVNTGELINIVSKIAGEVWREHYSGIVPAPQIDYMLKKFQSASAVAKQIGEENYKYYLMQDGEKNFCGYFAVVVRDDKLFLSKIYVKKESRQKGFAKKAVAFLAGEAKKLNLSAIELTVSRENKQSIEAYKKMNFETDGEINLDIGGGFFMNDYKMSLKVK